MKETFELEVVRRGCKGLGAYYDLAHMRMFYVRMIYSQTETMNDEGSISEFALTVELSKLSQSELHAVRQDLKSISRITKICLSTSRDLIRKILGGVGQPILRLHSLYLHSDLPCEIPTEFWKSIGVSDTSLSIELIRCGYPPWNASFLRNITKLVLRKPGPPPTLTELISALSGMS